MEGLLYGSQVIEGIMKKPEFSFLVKYYNLLYQSLIPNCSLTIKILRQQHLNITRSVELYILSGSSRRQHCQRLTNFLLVYLNNVKDCVQFCHYVNLITVMTDLPYRMTEEFRTSGQWGHAVPHHPKPSPQKINKHIPINRLNDSGSTKLTKDIHSVDHNAPHSVTLVEEGVRDDDCKVVSVVGDDGASVDTADKPSISEHYNRNSRRRHVASLQRATAKHCNKSVDGISSTGVNATMTRIEQRSLHMPISLDLEFMLSSSEWSIVDTFFSPLCDCLPQDYQSTIEKLKSFPQFAGAEHQHQLKSLIPATLTDIDVINEKILTFLVMNLCYDTNSGGITRLCDVMEQLIEFSESTTCIQEIRCAVSNDTVSLPPTTSPSQPTDSLHQTCDTDVVPSAVPVSSSSNHSLVTALTDPHTTEPTNTVTDEVSPINNAITVTTETDTTIPGLQVLISQYQVILQSLPMDYENTLNLLQNYLTDDQICQILNSPNYSAANKAMLDCLIEKFKESVDISELCKKLELIASLSTSKQLSSIVSELKAATSRNSTQEHEPPVTEELKLPQILTVDEGFVRLKAHYHTILHLMPDDYEQSIGKLQNYFSDEQICEILYSSGHATANKLILDYLIEKMSCKEDQLDLCDQLEKIAAASNELNVIIQELRSGVEHAQLPDDDHDQEQQSGIIADSFGVMYNMAFNDLRLDSDSKVVAVLKTNYNALCNCLPKDSMVTIKRLKQHKPSAIELVEDRLILLPPDHANAMIVVLLIKHLSHETEVLSLCDLLENIVDEGAPKKYIYTLRSELIEALSAFTEVSADAAYFDRLIFSHMQTFSNFKVLAVLKKHCSKLCECLPQDYMRTLDRIRRRASVPEGLVQQLSMLPTAKQVNHHIIAAMVRPLTNEAGVLGFCDIMESVLEDERSQAFIESVRNEICEALSLPTVTTTVATTVNIIKPISMPLLSTIEQSPADQKPSGTETLGSSETSSNASNEMIQTGTSNSTTTIPRVSSTEVTSTDTLT